MAWFRGTSTGYTDMLDILEEIGAGEHISAIEVYNGGSGHAIGDVLTPSTGTYDHAPAIEVVGVTNGDTVASTTPSAAGTGYNVGDLVQLANGEGTWSVVAILEVTSVGGSGDVTGLQVNNPGAYSVQPTGSVTTTALTGSGDDALTVTLTWNTSVTGIINEIFIADAGAATATPTDPVATTSDGSGTGATFNLTWTETAWETKINYNPDVVDSWIIKTAGTGYNTGDVIQVDIGAGEAISHATFVVTASAGAVTSLTIQDEGYYITTPANDVTTTLVTGSGGSGCTLEITWTEYTDASNSGNRFFIMHNTVEDVYFGIRARYYSPTLAYVWQLAGMTGYTAGVLFGNQPGKFGDACFMPMAEGLQINYWLSISDRRIIGIFEVDGTSIYHNMYVGLIDPTLTEDEYPFPYMILGDISQNSPYNTANNFGGMHNPGRHTDSGMSTSDGPGAMVLPDGTRKCIANWFGTTTVNQTTDSDAYRAVCIYPCGFNMQASTSDWGTNTADQYWEWDQVASYSVTQTSFTFHIGRINDEYVMIPCEVMETGEDRMLGTMTGVYWFDNYDAALVATDRIWVDGEPYRVFKNGAASNKNAMFALKEA